MARCPEFVNDYANSSNIQLLIHIFPGSLFSTASASRPKSESSQITQFTEDQTKLLLSIWESNYNGAAFNFN